MSSSSLNREPYRPVSTDEDDQGLSTSEHLEHGLTISYQSAVLWICIACTAMNVFTLYLNSWVNHRDGNFALNRKTIHTLRRPSQYIGFDTITRPSPPIARNFTNFPFGVAQINADEPFKIFDAHSTRFMSLSGTVYPEDKKVVVVNKVSTIMQFRAIDYGMEICELQINLPLMSTPAGEIKVISIYRLESSVPLDLETLSYMTSPRRIGRLGEIRALPSQETHWHRRMSCTLEEVITIELSCPQDIPINSRCNLEWSQHKEEATPGNIL
ncbi:hypothetical protein H0H87_003046 [Tephrocybe sp. NHM501043]|nr:hypothetical protein H0H87_003046 [Tephrocybe sp. NHM501043]